MQETIKTIINKVPKLVLPSQVSFGTTNDVSSTPSGNFLCLIKILSFNLSGDGMATSFFSTGSVNNRSPKTFCIAAAMFLC